MSYNVRKNANTYYVRYENGTAYLYSGDVVLAEYCNPVAFLTSWKDPDTQCSFNNMITGYDILEKTYWQPPNISSIPAKNIDNPDLSTYRSVLCNSTPSVNLSTKIRILVEDSEFGGIYTFDYANGGWVLNESETATSLVKYNDTTSTYHDKYLVNLTTTELNSSPYQGYIEYSYETYVLDNSMSIKQDAYAFPCRFVFTAIKHPNDVSQGLNYSSDQNDIPTGSGTRFVSGFKIPLEFRLAYKDFKIASQLGYYASGIPNNYVLGYPGQGSEAYNANISISGISNNPYYVYDTATPKTPICTSISDGGFAYKVSASGFGFDNLMTSSNLSNYLSARSFFEKYPYTDNNSNQYIYDPTVITSSAKIPSKAMWGFAYSCDPYIEPCQNTNYSVTTKNNPNLINQNCFGSTVNIDYGCTLNAKPTNLDFTNIGITSITPIYSGVDNLQPLLKNTDVDTSGYLYSLSPTEVITFSSGNYDGNPNPDNFREWVNKNLQFVAYENGSITSTADNVDIYWVIDSVNNTNMYARLFPDYSTININYGLIIGDAEVGINGKYNWDENTNRWALSSNINAQMRCVNDQWLLGIVINNNFVVQYELIAVTNTNGYDSDQNANSDSSSSSSSTYSATAFTCRTIPIGTWSNDSHAGDNALITSYLGPVENNETQLPITFFESCETLELMYQKENVGYTPLVELSINGKIGSGSEQLEDAVSLTWEIDNAFVRDFVFATNRTIDNLEEQIVEYEIVDKNNDPYWETKNVKVYLYCNNGMFYLNIDSTGAFNDGTYNYSWRYIEVPVNTLGLPAGTVSLSTPTTDDTQEDVFYTDGGSAKRPIVPTITFT